MSIFNQVEPIINALIDAINSNQINTSKKLIDNIKYIIKQNLKNINTEVALKLHCDNLVNPIIIRLTPNFVNDPRKFAKLKYIFIEDILTILPQKLRNIYKDYILQSIYSVFIINPIIEIANNAPTDDIGFDEYKSVLNHKIESFKYIIRDYSIFFLERDDLDFYDILVKPAIRELSEIFRTNTRLFYKIKYIPIDIISEIEKSSSISIELKQKFISDISIDANDHFVYPVIIKLDAIIHLLRLDIKNQFWKEELLFLNKILYNFAQQIYEQKNLNLYQKLIDSIIKVSELDIISSILDNNVEALRDVVISAYEEINKHIDQFTDSQGNILIKLIQLKILQLLESSEERLATPPKTTHKNWNRKLISLKLEASNNINKEISLENAIEQEDSYNKYLSLVEPAIKSLAKIFLMQPIAFKKAKYAAISICEEILYRIDEKSNNNNIKVHVYYHLANFNSHTKHDIWRSGIYAKKLKEIEVVSSLVDVDKVQNPGDQTYSGLARYTGSAHSTSLEKE